MKKIVIVALIVCTGLTAQAQISNYLAPGKSGLGIQAIGELSSRFNGFGGGIGGTYKGKIDVNLLYTSDNYNKEGSELVTDKAHGNYLEGKVTWWLFRNQVTPGIEARFGVLAGFESAFYKDFKYLNPTSRKIIDYTKYMGGMAGLQAVVGFNLSEKWILQPSFMAYLDIGNDFESEEGIESPVGYTGVISNFCVSLIRRVGEGNAFVISANNFFQTYDSTLFYNLTAGYIFSF